MKIFASLLAAAWCSQAFSAVAAHAQYPERPITLVIPYGAGGATDIAGRNLAHP